MSRLLQGYTCLHCCCCPAITHHSWDRDLADTAQPEEEGDSWKEMSSTYLSTVYRLTMLAGWG